jgi:hypothetical protein
MIPLPCKADAGGDNGAPAEGPQPPCSTATPRGSGSCTVSSDIIVKYFWFFFVFVFFPLFFRPAMKRNNGSQHTPTHPHSTTTAPTHNDSPNPN